MIRNINLKIKKNYFIQIYYMQMITGKLNL